MGVTSTGLLPDITTLDEGVCFQLVQSDIGDETVSKEIGYKVCVNGEEVTDTIVLSPKASGEPAVVNPVDIIQGKLFTTVPILSKQQQQVDENFKADVKLKYGEVVVDYEDCENNQEDINSETDSVTIINAYNNKYTDRYFDEFFLQNNPLATMPKYIEQCEGTFDWLWLCDSSITVEASFSNGSTAVKTYTASEAEYVAVGSGNLEMEAITLPNVPNPKITCIKIYNKLNTLVSTVKVVPCCCSSDCRADLYFLDQFGSIRAVGGFKCVESREAEHDGTVICKEMPCTASKGDKLRYGGDMLIRKGGKLKMTFKQKFNINCNNRNFYDAFGASGHYWVRTGSYLVRFIATTKNIPTYTDNDLTEITFSGYLANGFNGHISN